MIFRPISAAGEALIKGFEGFKATPYKDVAGLSTVGYGHLLHSYDNFTYPLSEEEATELLLTDLQDAYMVIYHTIRVPLNDNQYAALCSLAFNLGFAPFEGHLGLYVNQQEWQLAADEFLKWCHAKENGVEVVVPGLVTRREQERALFLQPVNT